MRRYAKTSGIDGENLDPGHQITYHTVIVMVYHSTFRHPLLMGAHSKQLRCMGDMDSLLIHFAFIINPALCV
jgi:hypothetical protein